MTAAYRGAFGGRTRRATNLGPLSATQRRALAGARQLGVLMDARFRILGFRFGLDSIIGLIPGIGDAVSALASAYLIGVGVQLGLPKRKLMRMLLNSAADLGIGLVPGVGDLADVIFKSHMRNLRILEEHARRRENVVEGRVTRR